MSKTNANRALRAAVPLIAALAAAPAAAWWWGEDAPAAEAAAETLEVDWEDLLPEGFAPAEDPTLTMSTEELDALFDGSDASNARLAELERTLAYAPVDETLDGRLVTLPGYVVPLDFDGATRLEEFLLVPYFGACIHTPPPPANQIVMASLERPVELEDPYLPVVLRGVLRTETTTSALAEAGYRMDVVAVEPYEEAPARR